MGTEFYFRVWVHPVDGDPSDVYTWYQGLEPTDSKSSFIEDWSSESLRNEDFHELFDLDPTKHWQVVGKAKIYGSFDYWGEYDEEITIIEFQKAEVPDSFFDTLVDLEADES